MTIKKATAYFSSLASAAAGLASLPNGTPYAILHDGIRILGGVYDSSQDVTQITNGKMLDLDWLSDDAVGGYSIEEGSGGVSVDSNGHLVCLADDSNPTVRVRFPLLGSRYLWTEATMRFGFNSVVEGQTGTRETSTRLEWRLIGVGSPVDATFGAIVRNAGQMRFYDGRIAAGVYVWTAGGGNQVTEDTDLLFRHLMTEDTLNNPVTSPNAFSVLRPQAALVNGAEPRGAGTKATHINFTMSDPTQLELAVFQGPAGSDITATLKEIMGVRFPLL